MEANKDKHFLTPAEVHNLKMDPPDNAWDLLDAALDKKMALENKGGFNARKVIVIGIILLLISIATYFVVSPKKNSGLVNNIEKKEIPSIKNDNNIKSFESKKDLNNQPNQNSVSPIVLKDIDKKQNTTSEKSNTNSTSPIVKPENKNYTVKKQDHKKINNEPVKIENKKMIADSNQKIINGEENINSSTENISSNKKVINSDNSFSSESIATDNPQGVTAINGNIYPAIIGEDTISKKSVIAEENKNIVLTNSDTALNNLPIEPKNNFSIAAFYSPDFTKNHLTPNSSGGNEPVFEYYDHEKVNYSFSAGIKIQYDLSKHLGFATGATYSTLSYTSDLTTIYADYNVKNQLNYLYTTSCGNIEIPNDNVTAIQKGDSLKLNTKCKQSVKFISIPLMVNYQLTKNRFSIYGFTGVAANFVLLATAKLQLNNTPTTIINHVDGIKKMNYSFLVSAGVRYRAFNHLGIFIEPSYRGSINSLTQNISVNCYPFSLGLKMGLFYHF